MTTVATELLTDSSGGESTLGISSAIDMWIKLRREERDYTLHRLLTVVKSRGMPTADYVNEYTLSDQGVVTRGRPGTQGAEPS
ncbi:MAG: hypothetical protein U5P41_02920 [Gammaproteobacteria bacterium]|nr:hypothetical protein [Gammaproteobacteria bacterium]